MSQRYCPECGGSMAYDISVKSFTCKGCGLFATRDQLSEIKEKAQDGLDENRKRKNEHGEYLDWWLSSKKK